MIVTIDGPAGAGKSSVAKSLAKRLGFRFLDTGAMYRAVTYAAVQRDLDWNQPESLVALVPKIRIELPDDRVLLDGEDISQPIRTSMITCLVHYAANNAGVRAQLVAQQRREAGYDSIVTEGRDQGTVVFPYAECKIFLTATPEERARRRQLDLQKRGETLPFEQVLAEQNERDRSDRERDVGPLRPAADAIEVITDGMTPDQVVDRLEAIVRGKMARRGG